MKYKYWVILLVLFAGILFCIFLSRPKSPITNLAQPKSQNDSSASGTKKPADFGTRSAFLDNNQHSSTNHSQANVPPGAFHSRLELIQQAFAEKNVPIFFYGKIIDQDGSPLSGVKIRFYVRHWELTANADAVPVYLERASDADGRFEVSGVTGDGCSIEYMGKDNYEPEPGQQSFGAASGTFSSPVILKMWRANIHEHLLGGEKKFQIVPDGRSYLIDLGKGDISETSSGNLRVWIKTTTQTRRGQLYDWSCEIDAINGGIIEEPLGTAMYEAPIAGYTPTFQFQQQIKGGQSGSTGPRQFYVTLNNGQQYGQISIELYAPYNNQIPGLIRLSYVINPSGSRILR